MFEGYQFWQPSREEDHPTKSQFPKFGAENWEDTYALEAYPLVNIHSLLLKMAIEVVDLPIKNDHFP
jgi:hypothetical protein